MKVRSFVVIFSFMLTLVYLGVYAFLLSIKEEQANIFKGQSLPANYQYPFKENFEEITLKTNNGGLLNALLFKADSTKGVICFWKGNGGSLKNWGAIAPSFLELDYDIIITDYRQHGKSKGKISLANFYSDAQTVYDFLKERYSENKIVIVGYSLGGRIAAHLATKNKPKITVLIDAASTTGDFSQRFFEFIYSPLPSTNEFLFNTESDVSRSKAPVVIIATDNPNSLSHQLKLFLKNTDFFIGIKGATHQTILGHKETANIMFNVLK